MPKTIMPNPWRLFWFELGLFFSSLVLGVLGGWRLHSFLKVQKAETLAPVGLWQFLLYFAVGTGILVAFIYFFKFQRTKGVILRILFLLTVFMGLFFFLGLWLPALPCLALTGFLVFLWLKRPCLWVHNLVFVLALAGVGSSVGLRLGPETVALLFLILAVYDYVAVYKTRHMVKLAKEMVEQKAVLGFVIPSSSQGLSSDLGQVKPGGRFLVLGGGDVVFPIIFCVSLMPQGFWAVVIVGLFSVLGLIASFLLFIHQKERQPIPALPSIAVFSVLGFLLFKLL